MKKIIATALCLTLATPCFAAGRFHDKYPNRGFHNPEPPRYERCDYNDIHKHPRTSQRTRTIGAVAGIAGIAMIISAIVD